MSNTFQGSFILANNDNDIFTDAKNNDLLIYSVGTRILLGQSNGHALIILDSNLFFASNITTDNITVQKALTIKDCFVESISSPSPEHPIYINSDVVSGQTFTVSNIIVQDGLFS